MKKTIYIALSILIIISCTKSEISPINGIDSVDVYVVGYQLDENYTSRAFISKNNDLHLLTSQPSRANAVYVNNNDVYVVGISTDDIVTTAVYWKNDVLNTIETNAIPHDICVHNNDIYITGIENGNRPVYWKNSQKNYLPTANYGSGQFSKMRIVFDGNDMYINGDIQQNFGGTEYKAVYWKNGVINYLTNNNLNITTTGIAVSYGSVYVSGYITDPSSGNIGVYWKDGVLNGIYDAFQVTGIKVIGTDVYLSGTDTESNSVYWKNEVKTLLTNGNYSDNNDIEVVNGNIFNCGNLGLFPREFIIWINNVIYTGAMETVGRDMCVVENN